MRRRSSAKQAQQDGQGSPARAAPRDASENEAMQASGRARQQPQRSWAFLYIAAAALVVALLLPRAAQVLHQPGREAPEVLGKGGHNQHICCIPTSATPRAPRTSVQHERVHSAVADSVVLLNSTLYESLNITLDGLAQHLASIQAIGGIKGGPVERTRPGLLAAKEGLQAKHPAVIVPGVDVLLPR